MMAECPRISSRSTIKINIYACLQRVILIRSHAIKLNFTEKVQQKCVLILSMQVHKKNSSHFIKAPHFNEKLSKKLCFIFLSLF